MRLSRIGLLASALLLFATSANADPLGDIQAQLDALRKQDTYKVNTGSLSIESWLLTSTAIDATADKIHEAIGDSAAAPDGRILVVAAAEPLDFGKAVMLKSEIEALKHIILRELGRPALTTAPIAFAGALVGLLKSETELTPIAQNVDAKLLASAVASKFPMGIIPSAAVTADVKDGALINSFKELVSVADEAQDLRDKLAANNPGDAA